MHCRRPPFGSCLTAGTTCSMSDRSSRNAWCSSSSKNPDRPKLSVKSLFSASTFLVLVAKFFKQRGERADRRRALSSATDVGERPTRGGLGGDGLRQPGGIGGRGGAPAARGGNRLVVPVPWLGGGGG